MRIALIGCGEVGRCYAPAIVGVGHTLDLCDVQPSAEAFALAADLDCPMRETIDGWLKEADVALSAVTGAAAPEVFVSARTHLRKGAIYGDLTTAAPDEKRECGAMARDMGVAYVDVAIMGAISLSGVRTPLLLAGPGSQKLALVLSAFEAPTELLADAEPGDAILIKLLRSIFTKGLEAISVECLIAAERKGLRERLFRSLADIERIPLRNYIEMLVRTHVVHAVRREREVWEAEEQLVRAGLPVHTLSGVRARFAETVAELKQHPPVGAAPTFNEALAWLVR